MMLGLSATISRVLPRPSLSLFVVAVLILSSMMNITRAGEAECLLDKPRMITLEELATKDGTDGTIWISVVGEVYDVSVGKDFYGPSSSYNVFAGRDSTVCFVTGAFTVEEAKKSLDTLSINQLGGIESWRDFYASDEKYPFVGLLVDPRYYDEAGNPTPALEEYRARLQTARDLAKEKAATKN